MIFAVDRYIDALKVKQERETVPDFGGKRSDRYHYFDTEEDAKAFLRERACKAHEQAERELERARQRVNRVNRKFISALRADFDRKQSPAAEKKG